MIEYEKYQIYKIYNQFLNKTQKYKEEIKQEIAKLLRKQDNQNCTQRMLIEETKMEI